jgi:hypothetical protein
MINTGENTELNNIKIEMTDDVNSNNIEKVKTFYRSSVMHIDTKFELPNDVKNIGIQFNSATVEKIKQKLDAIEQEVNAGKSSKFISKTQFDNFKAKIYYWCSGLFKSIISELDKGNTQIKVFIDNDISKHEWIMVQWLSKLGVSFFIISRTLNKLEIDSKDETILVIIYGTNERLSYKEQDKSEITQNEVKEQVLYVFNNIDEIEKAIYEDNRVIKLIVKGSGNYKDTCDFYGKLHKKSVENNDWLLFKQGFDKPTYEQTSKMPRLRIDEHSYILETMLSFLEINDTNIKSELKDSIKALYNSKENISLDGTRLYNRLITTICTLNTLFSKPIKTLIYYGAPNASDNKILTILSTIKDISVIILISDKTIAVDTQGYSVFEMENSVEYFEMPTVDTRENIHTMASIAEKTVNDTLFTGDTLGMYKPGQFRCGETKRFTTTFDEINLWWNTELYTRPGFEAHGDTAIMPTMFKVINGVEGGTSGISKYLWNIQELCYGKTILYKSQPEIELYGNAPNNADHTMYIRHLADTNGRSFEERNTKLFDKHKLNRELIKRSSHYTYGFISENKQNMILSVIEQILNSNYINKKGMTDEKFIDGTLNTLLNLNLTILQAIQWFEFYNENPNVIVLLPNEAVLNTGDAVRLLFLSLMGFDILLFVPTCYNVLNNNFTMEFQYDTHNIGESVYYMNTFGLAVTDKQLKPQKKQGIFSKIFK